MRKCDEGEFLRRGGDGSLVDERLCGFEESKSIDVGKRGRKAVESERQVRGRGGTSIADKALMPTESPMRTLCSGHHLLLGPCHRFWRRWRSHSHYHCFGTYDFQPVAPDLTAWPILHQHREVWAGFRHRWW